MPETREPYDLPFPDHWPPGRPEYVIVVDQLRDWQPGQAALPRRAPGIQARPHLRTRTRTRLGSRTMTLTINDTTMTSDQTAHTARQAPGSQHLWEVSWLPGRALDRNSAITAMTQLADHASEPDLNEPRLWPAIESWAAELGLTGPDAINRASQRGSQRQQHDREREPPDPEAGQ